MNKIMTLEDVKKNIDIITKAANGKQIQYKKKSTNNQWLDMSKEEKFCFYTTEYRVKPENRLVPLELKEIECIPIRTKNGTKCIILEVNFSINHVKVSDNPNYISTGNLLNLYENLDGTPLGKWI